MAVNPTTPNWYRVFGEESVGASPEERAASSSVRFVRGQDELSVWNPAAKGRDFKAKEALQRFGAVRLQKVWEDGFAVLPPRPSEPSKTLRERRETLGLTQTELAKFVNLPVETIAKAESPDYTNNIHDLMRIAITLGLDEATIGFQPGAGGDKSIAVRLREWRDGGETPKTIATLSEITWVMMTECRLRKLLTPNSNPLGGFSRTDDYGSGTYPVWNVARDLATETRRLLGISVADPIPSLRELCDRLEVPLVHAELPKHIAGATLATGNIRGIVVNVADESSNVWVQRATVAHELAHLLWDPAERLKSLVVDDRTQVEVIDRKAQDYVEARANAFAVELLAPMEAIREATRDISVDDFDGISRAIRDNMERFGLSLTAMRYHMWNAFDPQFDLQKIPYIDPTPTDEWKGREQFTDDFFVFRETPIERKGQFAAIVAKAEREGWLSEQTAAYYFCVGLDEYRKGCEQVLHLYDA